jgi:hypothetical protein
VKRRLFLKGVGGAALATPFLGSLERSAKAQATIPKRLVIFYTNNGCITNRWFPSVEDGPIDATALAGKTLEPLAPLASKLLFPRGIGMYPRGQVTVNGVTYFDPHDQGMGSKLTCGPIDPEGEHWALQRSLDHVAAELVNPAGNGPLVLSVGNAFANVKSIVSYSAAQEPYTPETKPTNVFNSLTGLFGAGSGQTPTEADYRVKQGKSIIDLVRGDLDTLKGLNMSGADKKRIDDWLALLRETEVPIVSAACNAETATALGITEADVKAAGQSRDAGAQFTTGGDMMIKLMALTMMCDANRVLLLQWPGFAKFTWDGMAHEYDHHGLSHRNGSADVGGTCVANVIEQLHQIDTWYTGRFTKLVNQINAIPEGDGTTMLDHSGVMWLPELADGNAHNNNNLPIVIAGSMGGYLKTGQAINLDTKTLGTGNSEASCTDGTDVGFGTGSQGGNVPINQLYVTLLNALGATNAGQPITTFGVCDSNEVEAGITKPGELDLIKV